MRTNLELKSKINVFLPTSKTSAFGIYCFLNEVHILYSSLLLLFSTSLSFNTDQEMQCKREELWSISGTVP